METKEQEQQDDYKISVCPKCEGENIEFIDDSFSHEFGTEIIRYHKCENCDWEEE